VSGPSAPFVSFQLRSASGVGADCVETVAPRLLEGHDPALAALLLADIIARARSTVDAIVVSDGSDDEGAGAGAAAGGGAAKVVVAPPRRVVAHDPKRPKRAVAADEWRRRLRSVSASRRLSWGRRARTLSSGACCRATRTRCAAVFFCSTPRSTPPSRAVRVVGPRRRDCRTGRPRVCHGEFGASHGRRGASVDGCYSGVSSTPPPPQPPPPPHTHPHAAP
jgi:hypothetical protein